jgi:hypothetical protein
MKAKRNKRGHLLIAERLEIQSDPSLHETPEVKSRLVSDWSSAILRTKLALIKQQRSCSPTEILNQLSDFLNRLTQREQLNRRPHV